MEWSTTNRGRILQRVERRERAGQSMQEVLTRTLVLSRPQRSPKLFGLRLYSDPAQHEARATALSLASSLT